MNWLAHIFISKNVIDYQLGNLLADPLKGKTWAGASQQVEDGFKMHGSIDSFTDSNEYVSKSKARLARKGHLKGVVIDIAYDYLLIKNWDRFSTVDLEYFINTFYQSANATIAEYPSDARRFVKRIIDYDVLTSYASFSGLEAAFLRIDHRLSERFLVRESAVGYLPALKKEISGIEEDFSHFFPQLVDHFKAEVGMPLRNHWLR